MQKTESTDKCCTNTDEETALLKGSKNAKDNFTTARFSQVGYHHTTATKMQE